MKFEIVYIVLYPFQNKVRDVKSHHKLPVWNTANDSVPRYNINILSMKCPRIT